MSKQVESNNFGEESKRILIQRAMDTFQYNLLRLKLNYNPQGFLLNVESWKMEKWGPETALGLHRTFTLLVAEYFEEERITVHSTSAHALRFG